MRKVLALAVVAGLLIVAACDTADTTAPIVSIVLPAGGDTLAKGSIVITAIATDNKAVAKVEFYADGSILGTDNATRGPIPRRRLRAVTRSRPRPTTTRARRTRRRPRM